MERFKGIITFVKWLWVIAIIGFLGVYFYRNYEKTTLIFSELPLTAVLLAFGCLLPGKLLLVLSMFFSLRYVSVALPYRQCFTIYNVSQLAKYLPGFIWQFIGRIGSYINAGVDASRIRNSMLVEFISLILGAFLYGAIFINMSDVHFFLPLYREHPSYIASVLALASILIVIVLVLKLNVVKKCARFVRRRMHLNGIMLVIQFGIWLCLGLSFSVLLGPYLPTSHWLFTIGLYAIAYVIGFTFPFASAGIGIRESIIILGISGVLGVDYHIAIMISTVHRIIYTVLEVGLAGFSLILGKIEKCSSV